MKQQSTVIIIAATIADTAIAVTIMIPIYVQIDK